MRKIFKIAAGMAPGLFALMLFCSSPTDQSLKWHTALEIPISSQKFFADSLMGWFTLDSNTRIIGSGDTSKLIDTLAYSTTQKDSIAMTYKAENLSDKVFHANVGPIPLTGLAPKTALIPLGPLVVTTDIPLPTVTDTLFIPDVRKLTFDNGSVPLQIQLTNTTPSTIKNITFSILGFVTTTNVGNLAPGDSTTFSYPVGGYGVVPVANHDSSFMLLQMTGTIAGTGSPVTITAGQGLSCRMSFAGMTLGDAIVKNSLISFSQTFTNHYKITDSVDLDYVDITTGAFEYILNNGTGTPFMVHEVHEDLWDQTFCKKQSPPLQTITDLTNFLSSKSSAALHSDTVVNFKGGVTTNVGTLVYGRQIADLSLSSINLTRLFLKWDSTLSNSVTTVNYILQSEPTSLYTGWDTISSMDSIVFTIKSDSIQFHQMAGTVVHAFEKSSDTTKKAIPFMWTKASKDSLRGKFLLSSVKTAVNISIDLPDTAMIEAFVLTLTIKDSAHTRTKIDTLKNVVRNKVFHDIIDITQIVDDFPDSVSMYMHAEVPVGVRLIVVNNFQSMGNTGAMLLNGIVDDQMIAKLDWTVTQSVPLDMGSAKFKLDPSIKKFKKLTNPVVAFNTNLINNTNINGTLYGLLDPKKGRFEFLDSMSTDSVEMLTATTGVAESNGYINVLGASGVKLPQYYSDTNLPSKRDTIPWKVQPNSVQLDDQQMNLLLASDSCAIRWIIRFNKGPRDALRNNDYVNIESWIKIEGINSMDSTTSLFK